MQNFDNFDRYFKEMNKNIFLAITCLSLLTVCCCCKKTIKTGRQGYLENHKLATSCDSLEYAWEVSDSAYIKKYISDLSKYYFPEFGFRVYDLSYETGFGWAFIDPYDSIYQKNDSGNLILRQNMITGFEIYAKSKWFMLKTPRIVVYQYIYYGRDRLLIPEEKGCLLRFADAIGDSTFYNYYKIRE